MNALLIDPDHAPGINSLFRLVCSNQPIALSPKSIDNIVRCRKFLEDKLQSSPTAIYGINTGFGALYNKAIDANDLGALQRNLLLSHACGTGNEIAPEIVRLMMVLKVVALSKGHSGVTLETVQQLVDCYNAGLVPVIYSMGSLGASGDLAPLAHLCLPMIGEGEVYFNGSKMAAGEALHQAGLKPITLRSKEGLALINGTQFMLAHGLWCMAVANALSEISLHISALALEAFDGRRDAFDPEIAAVRPHPGMKQVCAQMNLLLEGSDMINQPKQHVQDPYSFRCIPQVLGAVIDVFAHARQVIECEMSGVTDNPLIFPESGKIISGGNFHGEPLAITYDSLAIALAEMGSISERRTYKLINGLRGLPPFLAKDAGLNSGFMIPQYTAASLVSRNKQLCTPASVDTIDSSNGQEDHVSMGANGATRCIEVLNNTISILSIEWMTAAQAFEFRRPLTSSKPIESALARIRQSVPFLSEDDYLHAHMRQSESLLWKWIHELVR
ncbi:MAG: histidine ammonia-lyase [Flavobacteriales bacterium]|nr:histidine ammonia-lyase [Flavobacteriales bacterium]